MEKILTTENFEEIVMGADVPVLVDFWATWCGPCMMLAPTVEEIAKENEGSLIVGKVNVDDHPALAAQFGIASIPTLLLFKDGQLVDTMIGLRSKAEIEKMFK